MSSTTTKHDVIVVGVGSMGSAACCHLAQRGASVLGLEQHHLIHDLGSHHGQARMIRQAYFEHPDYVPLLRRAFQNWDELEATSGRRSLHRTGGLYIGDPFGAIVGGSLVAARQHDLAHEMLDADQLRDRYPQFHLPPEMVGFYEPEAGYVVPETAVSSHIEVARRHGADLRENQTVLDWRISTSGDAPSEVVVRTGTTSHRARHLLLTAGAWTTPLIGNFAKSANLTVTRQIQAWFQPRQPDAFRHADSGLPSWFIESDPPFGHYGFPIPDIAPAPQRSNDDQRHRDSMKVAIHRAGLPTDPDLVNRQVASTEIEALLRFLRSYLPGAVGPLTDSSVCLYTNSPDGHFIVGAHPDHPQVTVACGFSGHGFKFASVMGEILADLALKGRSDLPIDFLSPHRLA